MEHRVRENSVALEVGHLCNLHLHFMPRPQSNAMPVARKDVKIVKLWAQEETKMYKMLHKSRTFLKLSFALSWRLTIYQLR